MMIDEKKLKNALFNHGVIAFPTETVMGLGVIFDDELAYKKLNKIKNRPNDKPYAMLLKDAKDIEKYGFFDEKYNKIIVKYMPGPLTILIKSKESVPSFATHSTNIVGIRVPDNKIIQKILSIINKPLLAPSANKSGEQPCTTYKQVEREFKNELDYIVNIDSLGNKPSTIIDISGENIKLIREGDIPFSQILEEINS